MSNTKIQWKCTIANYHWPSISLRCTVEKNVLDGCSRVSNKFIGSNKDFVKILTPLYCNASINLFKYNTEAYSEPCQTSKMELFAKIVNVFQWWIIFVKRFCKRSILDVWEISKDASEISFLLNFNNSRYS